MLVAAFEIKIGDFLAVEFGAFRGDGGPTGAGIDPDVEGVLAFFEAEWHADFRAGFFQFRCDFGGEFVCRLGEPNAGALFLDEAGKGADDFGAEERLLAFAIKDGEGDAPGALPRDAPVGTALDRATDAVASVFRNKLDAVDGFQRIGAEGVDFDEPLFDGAENDGRFRAPAMGVIVLVVFLREEVALVLQDLDDDGVGLEDVDAGEFRDTCFGGEAATVVDRREDGEAVLLAELIIVLAVAGGDVDEASSCFGGDEVGGENFSFAVVVEEGVLVGEADEVGAFPGAGD